MPKHSSHYKTLFCCFCLKGRKQNCIASDMDHWQEEYNTSHSGSVGPVSQGSQNSFVKAPVMKTQACCRLRNLCSFSRTSAVENVYICAKLNSFILSLKGQNNKVSLQCSQLYSFPACGMGIGLASLISSIYILHTSLSQLIYRKLIS